MCVKQENIGTKQDNFTKNSVSREGGLQSSRHLHGSIGFNNRALNVQASRPSVVCSNCENCDPVSQE